MGHGYRTHLLVEEREVRVVATHPRAHDVVEHLDARLEHPEAEIEVLLLRSLTHEQRRPRVWRLAGGACGTTVMVLTARRAASTRRQKRCGAREPPAHAWTKRMTPAFRSRSSSWRETSPATSKHQAVCCRTRRPCWRSSRIRRTRRLCLEIRSERSTRTVAPKRQLRRVRATRTLGRTAAQVP